MAQIVAVHGVGQQFKGDAVIRREWWPAFLGGLHRVGKDLADENEFVCPFYGHLFRKAATLSSSDRSVTRGLGNDEATLLDLLWHAAREVEPSKVPSPGDYENDTLARTPQSLQRALNALAKSSFWANASQSLLIGDLKQVVLYMNNPDVHAEVLTIVMDRITPDTRIVLGHSLGSVVAYEALCRKPENVAAFISLGSPLGIRNLIFDRLRPAPSAMGIGAWPGRVREWTNIADKGDIVALQKELAPLFGNRVKDVLVYNGSDAHHGERYLTTEQVGHAVSSGLWGRNS